MFQVGTGILTLLNRVNFQLFFRIKENTEIRKRGGREKSKEKSKTPQ